ncbi:Hsp33 family molecular chaperone HslO [Pontixanthobacter aquaemixtae]|uniref:Hsp33 family molecular chaperone HslO n=1 Tax=Pontixanthobacter aquaemixtae TaxID=1958940 RepID=A0A844ZU23_9SPHN|nr:Hsp33 family molecular chaperone HslO [Pontixanthobacter aquaemixtae]MXO91238.1 Hsp33 family molecular chaperone HslO [Pontixanthobacter aquaemixtae]
MTEPSEIFGDQLLGFTLPGRNARGRAVRLDKVLDTILSAHDYPPAITHLLAEALVLSALIGGLLKEEGAQMTMQAQTEDGVVRLLACDFKEGELRGYVDFDAARLAELGANPSLFALFGKGYLAITFDRPGKGGRYQGIVPLEGDTLSAACEAYFIQSEQIPTLIKIAVHSAGNSCVAAGLLVQHLPDGEEGRERLHARLDHPEWEHVSVLAGSTRYEELVDSALSLDQLIWRLFHEEDEIRVQPGADLRRGCRCSIEHYQELIGRFSASEREEMKDEHGIIQVDCAFCSKVFPIAA